MPRVRAPRSSGGAGTRELERRGRHGERDRACRYTFSKEVGTENMLILAVHVLAVKFGMLCVLGTIILLRSVFNGVLDISQDFKG